MTLQVTTPSLNIEKILVSSDIFHRLTADDCGKTSRIGYPELPIATFMVQVPNAGSLNAEILNDSSEDIKGLNVYPVPEKALSDEGMPTERFVMDKKAYSRNGFYPEKLVSVTRLGNLRGISVARVEMHPFQWNAVTGVLRYFRNIQLRITFERKLDKRSSISSPEFDRIKRKSILNFSAGEISTKATTRESFGTEFESDAVSDTRAQQRMRIEVRENGIYRISYSELATKGLPASLHPSTLQLHSDGAEVAIRLVTASPNVFAAGDYIEFYGEALNTRFTDINVYWLAWGEQQGRRMQSVDGTDTGTGTLLTAFYERLHEEQNKTWWSGTPGAPDVDYWLWEKMTAPARVDCSFQVPDPVPWEANATLRVGFQGRSTSGSHRTVVKLNGSEIANDPWQGATVFVQEVAGSQVALLNGLNTFSVELPGDSAPVDVVYLNWMELDYWRLLKAANNKLEFSVSGDGPRRVEVTGFDVSNLLLFDITDPFSVKEVTGFSELPDGETQKVVFCDASSNEKKYWIGAHNAVLSPALLEMWDYSDLKSTVNGADWIVITKKAFLSSVAPLVSLRESQGYRAKAVAVEDIYSEFNDGVFDPAAIKTFLQYAYDNWVRPAPTYVLLAGDANVDYRDYLLTGKQNVVPPHLIFVSYLVPTDNWYVCMDGGNDLMPDMFIGRIPGSSATMVSQEISKIMRFSPASSSSTSAVLLVSDNGESSFEDLNEALIPYLPAGFDVSRVYLSQYGNVAAATEDIIDYVDQGVLITNYVGHGNTNLWAGESLFTNRREENGGYSNDVDLLSNANALPFISAMTCLNGYFCLCNGYCLSEAFLAGENRGAIGMVAPSGLGYVWEHEILAKELFSTIFEAENGVMGSAVTEAKIAAYGKGITADALQTFTLFGDPATVLRDAPFSGTSYVCPDGVCGSKTPCYISLQAAITGPPVPDVVLVSEGVYTERVVFDAEKKITVEGGWNSTFTEKGGPTTRIRNPVVKSGSGKFLNLKIIP